MRTIVVTFEIEDNDLIEHKLFTTLYALGCKDFQKLPDTKELYENDENFRILCKKVKDAKRLRDDYYNRKRVGF